MLPACRLWCCCLLLAACGQSPSPTSNDPYRWLERESPERSAWVDARQRESEAWLDVLPGRDKWADRIRRVRDQPIMDVPRRFGDRDFVFFNTGLDDHFSFHVMEADVLAVCASEAPCRSLPARAEQLLDVSDWPTGRQLHSVQVSPDGQGLVYSQAGRQADDRLSWSLQLPGQPSAPVISAPGRDVSDWAAMTWAEDGTGLYAITAESPLRLYYLPVSSEDRRAARHLLTLPENLQLQAMYPVREGGLLLLHLREMSGREQLHLVDPVEGETTRLAVGWLDNPRYIGMHAGELYFISTAEAWQGEIISTPAAFDTEPRWQRRLPEQDRRLQQAQLTSGAFLLEYLEDARSRLYWHRLTDEGYLQTEGRAVLMPGFGRISALTAGPVDKSVHFGFSGLVQASAVYGLAENAVRPETLWQASPGNAEFEVRQLRVDGDAERPLPVYVAGKSSVLEQGDAALLLEVYGGFDIPVDISYSASRMAWMQQGGLLALAGVRGGGEYDESWYRQGRGPARNNSVKDVLRISEFLVDEAYTRSERIALSGSSHGGTLMAAAVAATEEMAKTPFAALILESAVLDMLRYPLSGAGGSWLQEYGDPADVETAAVLRRFSPYHQALAEGRVGRTPTLVVTAEKDPVVSPGHSYKYLAARQAMSNAPILLRIKGFEGHQSSGPVEQMIADYADRWAFLAEQLGLSAEEYDP